MGIMAVVFLAGAARAAGTFDLRTGQSISAQPVLDLTQSVPATQAGHPGIPGQSWSGGGNPGAADNSHYQLPLTIQILHSSTSDERGFVIEVLLRNMGQAFFDFPSSRDLAKVEQKGNVSQRILFFRVQPVGEKQQEIETIGFAATGGSTSVPNSFIRLAPGEALRVLLPASNDMVRRAFKGPAEQIELRVLCSEWQLEDTRYFIRASSEDTPSKNAIKFVLKNGKPIPLQP